MVIQSRRRRWAGRITYIRQYRKSCNILVGKPEDKISFGRHERRWRNNNKMDLEEIGRKVVD
jgi:hypothetical protein